MTRCFKIKAVHVERNISKIHLGQTACILDLFVWFGEVLSKSIASRKNLEFVLKLFSLKVNLLTCLFSPEAPILQNCAKLRMSSCSHLGYTHTTQSSDLQFILNNVLKGKNFGNHSTCSSTIKNILCAEFGPPCFPEHKEKIVLHTVCKSDCENVRKECPELYSKHFSEHSFCELMATEKSDLEGFCKLTKWPTAVRWPTNPNLTGKYK